MTKDMQTEQLLCWSGMTNTEHTTSGSNEEEIIPLHGLNFNSGVNLKIDLTKKGSTKEVSNLYIDAEWSKFAP